MKNKSTILTMDDMDRHDREELQKDGEPLEIVKSVPNSTIKSEVVQEVKKVSMIPDIFKTKSPLNERNQISIENMERHNEIIHRTNAKNDSMCDVMVSNAKMVECEITVRIPVFKTIDPEFFGSIIKNMNIDPNDIAESILKININEININALIKEAILSELTKNNDKNN